MNHHGDLKRGFRFLVLCMGMMIGTGSTFAEIKTLKILPEDIITAFPSDKDETPKTEYTSTFNVDDSEWTLTFKANGTFTNAQLQPSLSGLKNCVHTLPPGSYYNIISSVELSTDFFALHKIVEVRYFGFMFLPKVQTGISQNYTLRIGAHTYNSTAPVYSDYLNNNLAAEVFTMNPADNGHLSMTIDFDMGGRYALQYLEVDYDTDITVTPLTVSRVKSIPVGYSLDLNASIENAKLFYSTDGSDHWLAYNTHRGIIFEEPGEFTLRYFAEDENGRRSEIVTENLLVCTPKGLLSAMFANREIEISGIIIGHEGNCTFIADNIDDEPADCLVIDNSNYQQIAQARPGDTITAKGRATDRFGSDIMALGSLSDVTINGSATTPTNISSLRAQLYRSARAYNLQGRPVSESAKGVILSSDGTKRFNR